MVTAVLEGTEVHPVVAARVALEAILREETARTALMYERAPVQRLQECLACMLKELAQLCRIAAENNGGGSQCVWRSTVALRAQAAQSEYCFKPQRSVHDAPSCSYEAYVLFGDEASPAGERECRSWMDGEAR